MIWFLKEFEKQSNLVSNRCHDLNKALSVSFSLVLKKQQYETSLFSETEGFFCFLFNKRSPENALKISPHFLDSYCFDLCNFLNDKLLCEMIHCELSSDNLLLQKSLQFFE